MAAKLGDKGRVIRSVFRHVLPVLIDIVLVFDQLVLHHRLQIGAIGTHLSQAIDYVLHQVKTVQIKQTGPQGRPRPNGSGKKVKIASKREGDAHGFRF